MRRALHRCWRLPLRPIDSRVTELLRLTRHLQRKNTVDSSSGASSFCNPNQSLEWDGDTVQCTSTLFGMKLQIGPFLYKWTPPRTFTLNGCHWQPRCPTTSIYLIACVLRTGRTSRSDASFSTRVPCACWSSWSSSASSGCSDSRGSCDMLVNGKRCVCVSRGILLKYCYLIFTKQSKIFPYSSKIAFN